MAKKQTADCAASVSPKPASRQKGRQVSPAAAQDGAAGIPAAANSGIQTERSPSGSELLPVTVGPALESVGQADKPDDAGAVSKVTSASSEGNLATPAAGNSAGNSGLTATP